MPRAVNRQLIQTTLLVPVAFAIQYLAELEIARRIGPAEFGTYALMTALVATAVTVMLLGIPLSFPSLQGDDRRRIGHGAALAGMLVLPGSLAIFLVWLAVYADVVAAAGVAGGFLASSIWLLRRYMGVAVEQLLPGVFGPRELLVFPVVVLGLVVFNVSSGTGVYLLYAAVLLIFETVVLAYLKRRQFAGVRFRPGNRAENRFVIARGIGFLKNSLGNLAFTRADVIIVAFVLGGEELGVYALASRLALIGTLPIRILEVRFSPSIARRFAVEGYAGARAERRAALSVSLALSAAVLVPAVLAAGWLSSGIFEDFGSLRIPVIVLLSAHLCASALTPFGTFLSMTGHHHLRGNITLVAATILVPALLAGGALGGVNGAALAVAVVVVGMRLATTLHALRIG